MTKFITSLYSGWFLMNFAPAGVSPDLLHTETLWFVYGCIAIITPIALLLARGWMGKRLSSHQEVA